MISSVRRGICALIFLVFSILILSHEWVASTWDESTSLIPINTWKSGAKLPFTHILQSFQSREQLRDDNRVDRFVSKEFPLSFTGYAPTDLELLTWSYIDTAGRVIYLRREVVDALTSLAQDFQKEFGRPLVVVSGYRSANYQQRLWDLGRCTDTLCAPPGYSEHQLGLAIDIFEATTEKDYLANRAFARYLTWLQANADKYGFHQSYQKWEATDAYEVEPWHWRYLGKNLASKLKSLDMTYTEYIEFTSMRYFWRMY